MKYVIWLALLALYGNVSCAEHALLSVESDWDVTMDEPDRIGLIGNTYKRDALHIDHATVVPVSLYSEHLTVPAVVAFCASTMNVLTGGIDNALVTHDTKEFPKDSLFSGWPITEKMQSIVSLGHNKCVLVGKNRLIVIKLEPQKTLLEQAIQFVNTAASVANTASSTLITTATTVSEGLYRMREYLTGDSPLKSKITLPCLLPAPESSTNNNYERLTSEWKILAKEMPSGSITFQGKEIKGYRYVPLLDALFVLIQKTHGDKKQSFAKITPSNNGCTSEKYDISFPEGITVTSFDITQDDRWIMSGVNAKNENIITIMNENKEYLSIKLDNTNMPLAVQLARFYYDNKHTDANQQEVNNFLNKKAIVAVGNSSLLVDYDGAFIRENIAGLQDDYKIIRDTASNVFYYDDNVMVSVTPSGSFVFDTFSLFDPTVDPVNIKKPTSQHTDMAALQESITDEYCEQVIPQPVSLVVVKNESLPVSNHHVDCEGNVAPAIHIPFPNNIENQTSQPNETCRVDVQELHNALQNANTALQEAQEKFNAAQVVYDAKAGLSDKNRNKKAALDALNVAQADLENAQKLQAETQKALDKYQK